MEALFLICAEGVAFDQHKNTVSLLNIIEELSLPAFPAAIPSFSVASLIVREASEATDVVDAYIRIAVGAQEIFSYLTPLRFQGRNRLRSIVETGELVIPAPGILKVAQWVNGRQLAVCAIPVINIGKASIQNGRPVISTESGQRKPN